MTIATRPPTHTKKTTLSKRDVLLSGAHVRKRQYGPPPPTRYALNIGRDVSLELTLIAYEVTPNTLTLARIGGAE